MRIKDIEKIEEIIDMNHHINGCECFEPANCPACRRTLRKIVNYIKKNKVK